MHGGKARPSVQGLRLGLAAAGLGARESQGEVARTVEASLPKLGIVGAGGEGQPAAGDGEAWGRRGGEVQGRAGGKDITGRSGPDRSAGGGQLAAAAAQRQGRDPAVEAREHAIDEVGVAGKADRAGVGGRRHQTLADRHLWRRPHRRTLQRLLDDRLQRAEGEMALPEPRGQPGPDQPNRPRSYAEGLAAQGPLEAVVHLQPLHCERRRPWIAQADAAGEMAEVQAADLHGEALHDQDRGGDRDHDQGRADDDQRAPGGLAGR